MLHFNNVVSFFPPMRYLLLAILIFHFSLHSPNDILRLLLFPFFLYFAVLSFIASDKLFNPSLTSLWAQSVALNIVHIISLIFIEKHPAPRNSSERSILHPSAFLTTWRLFCNPQLLPEFRKAVPRTQAVTSEPKSVFLFLRLAKLLLYYCLHTHILPAFFSETILEIFPFDVSETALLSRLGNVSAREAVIRSYIAVSWIWESIVFLDGANAVLSLLAVVSGLDSPGDWPSMFGGLDEIRGLRSFWAKFWHRLALRPYKSCGRVVACGTAMLLGSGRNKWALPWMQGMIVAFVVFLLSGLSHAAVSWRLGMRDSLDIQWFLLNFVACFVETYILSALRYLADQIGFSRELKVIEKSWLGRVIGCLWVFAFFFWSVPLWKFPRIHHMLTAAESWKSIWSNIKVCGNGIPC